MAKTAERTVRDDPSAKDLGRQLRQIRRTQGLSRGDVARSAGLTRRELAAYERGTVHIPESDLWCVAGSCGVDVSDLLPHEEAARVRAMILTPLAISGPGVAGRTPSAPDAFAAAIEGTGPDAVDDFFAAPRADPLALAAPIAWRAPALVPDAEERLAREG